MRWIALVAVAECFACLLPIAAVRAQNIEKLVMPGPVARAHADTENACGACHSRMSGASQTQLCSACHKDVARDVTTRAGFHGRLPAASTAECRSCHTEHAGRGADIVRLDRELFDHSATDFPLQGAHRGVACEQCHASGKKYREAADDCAGCHGGDDVHKGRLGTDCASCHSDAAWRQVRFDHDKTGFPLAGKHANAVCNACHVDRTYANASTTCEACHRLDDPHKGKRGPSCEHCHSAAGWKKSTFSHARDTSFPLDGRHAAITCESCHAQDPYRVKTGKDCVACHRADDTHLGRNGARCAGCHVSTAWRDVTFDHERATGYALAGKHSAVACPACHLGPVYEVALDGACESCHRADDPHGGQEGPACGQCHNEAGWRRGVPFAHDITRFPLLGLHVAVPCEECHVTSKYRDASMVCRDCHAHDDVHAATLGSHCEQCHSPAGWPLWRFDHDRQTDFALLGAHRALTCAACHTQPVAAKVELDSTCGSCHRKEDAHRGRFGENCDRCHSPTTFRDVHIER